MAKHVGVLPHKVRETEKGRVNPAYTNLTKLGHFKPVEGITYLWVLNEKNEIIIGIQKPWEHPEAFNFDLMDENQKMQWEEIVKQLKTEPSEDLGLKGFGHPTLGASFTFETGEAIPGACYLGGELNCVAGQWVVDNKSSRSGQKNTTDLEKQIEIERILLDVKSHFERILSVKVKPELILENPHPNFSSEILSTRGRKTKDMRECLAEAKKSEDAPPTTITKSLNS